MTKEDLFGDELERRAQSASGLPVEESPGIPGGTVEPSPTPDHGDGDVNRRDLLQNVTALTAGAAAAPVFAALTQGWQDSEPVLAGASLSQDMIDDWEDAVGVHTQRARVEAPTVALAALAADFMAMAPHLARPQPEGVRRDLTHAAAQYAMLIAGKLVDLGDHRQSRRWWNKTRALGNESGDPLLASWLRGREALYRHGFPGEDLANVLAVAQDAERLAGDRHSVPLVSALASQAQILAHMGRYDDAIAALRKAEFSFDHMTTPMIVEDDWARREQGLWFDKSVVYTLAGDVRRATEAQDRYPKSDVGGAISISLHRAVLEARSDPAAGMEEASRIIQGIPAERRRTKHMTLGRIVLNVVPERARKLSAARELRALTAVT
ncbi:hypothetical protein [Actinomadura roseirufa]|uniref:hypothetical protein n=1 Tax=Actinomadura roseirufa TaxID=2094049 RepID=UPI00104106A9|nr:hypothetical protein [Actinomadura roseirufa]